jgi:hypothetical protein
VRDPSVGHLHEESAKMTDANRITMSFKRNDFCLLLDALEAIIEDFKYHGGLELAEEYIRMDNRLLARLQSHDTTTYRRGPEGQQ